MSKVELTDSERNVLTLCDSKQWQRVGRNTYGHELNRLVIAGMLETNGTEYRTTNAGREALKGKK
jgi:CheY-like chemotaxis protein